MKDNSPEKRHFSAESSKMSKRWIKRVIYFLEKFINIIYQIVSHLTPKKGNRILLMSETRSMGGNLQALDERLKVRGLDKSFRISYCFSKTLERSKIRILLIWLKLAFMTGRQDFIFVDDYVPFFKYINVHPKTKLIQVWHAGVGFKSVGYARFGEKGSPYPYASSHRKYDYVIVGGEALRDVYAEVFGVDREKCLPYGLMRMDGYLDQDKINRFKEQFYQEYKHLKGKKIILFAPTFRGNGQRNAYYPFEILEQDCGIHFSVNLIGKMLKSYYAASGYTYMSSFPNNLPWSFADIIAEMSLYGCLINPHQGLGPDLLKKLGQCSYIKLEPFGKYVQVLTNRFTDISFTFRNLRIDEDDVQHIDFVVSRQRSNDLLDVERVFGKSLTINELRFQDLLNTPRTLKEQTRASQCQKLTEEIFGP